MKRLIIIALLTCLAACPLLSQQDQTIFDSLDVARVQVMYSLTYREDSTLLDRMNKEKMILLIGDEISDFQSYGHYRLDRIRYEKMRDGTYPEWYSTNGHDYSCRFMFQILKNYPTGRMTVVDQFLFSGLLKYEEDLDVIDWDILSDSMYVAGYLCQKAVCDYGGRIWEAWFTSELPFSDGPFKFHGLPGLILKVSDTRNHYSFDFVSIEVPAKGTNIEWHDITYYGAEYVSTTRKGLFKVEDDMRENIMSHFDEQTSAEVQKKIYGVMRSRNNPIELDRK